MINIKKTDSNNIDFIELVKHLDADLAIRDGADHAFYNQFNKIDTIKYVLLAYENGKAVGCGAIKEYSPEAAEVKRMYTAPESRGLGVAGSILKELEQWANELGYKKCILETGIKQPEAIALYKKSGYSITTNYGQYAGVETSVCFEKLLSD
jgi:putative acetyltransferase